MRLTWAGLSVASLLACASPLGPVEARGGLAALAITNSSDLPVYHFVVERQTAALIDWIACTDPSCPNVAPHTRKLVPYDQIAGYEAGDREAIVYWWHLEPLATGGFQADSIRALVVRLGPAF